MFSEDEIIEMARDLAEKFGTRMCDENGDTHGEELYAMGVDDVIDIIKLVAAKEREVCAKVADGWSKRDDDVGAFIGKAIRARGEA